ncbi:MAG: DUF935 family protein [Verrucomicrobiota bacterium]
MLELIEREQLPTDVRTTLAGSLTGDLQRQQLLFQAMIDTWPRLQKALREVRLRVRKAPWKVVPWSERGEDPKPNAEKLAKEIEGLVWKMKPNAATATKGFEGTAEELAMAYFLGHQVLEVRWKRDAKGWCPESTKVVPPRFYGYPWSSEDDEDRLMLDRNGQLGATDFEDFPEHRFLLAVNGGHSGHPTVAAPLRALAQYWLAAVYGLKWGMMFAQLFGVPFRWAEYADPNDKLQVEQLMEKIGSTGWAAFKAGTKMNFLESSKGGQGSLPQWELIRLADEQCDVFVLGQTLTSSQGEKGSQALGTVHMEVREELVEGICDFVGEVLTHQLVPSIVELNHGAGYDDLPGIWAVFEKPKDEKGKAERMEIIKRIGVEVGKQWAHDDLCIPMPAEGEELLFQPGPDGAQGDPATGDELAPHETKGRRLEGKDGSKAMTPFPKQLKGLGIPRSEMPQIAAGNKSAMVQFFRKRGADFSPSTPPANELLPTQADYNREKVDSIREAIRNGDLRGGAILISSDGYVLDGHHRWFAILEESPDEGVESLRLDLPAARALMMLHRMPSTTVAASDAKDEIDPKKAEDLFEEMQKAFKERRLLDWRRLGTLLEGAAIDGAGD